jgi:hypothetical protein
MFGFLGLGTILPPIVKPPDWRSIIGFVGLQPPPCSASARLTSVASKRPTRERVLGMAIILVAYTACQVNGNFKRALVCKKRVSIRDVDPYCAWDWLKTLYIKVLLQ